jgi:hypothetical protein
VRNALGALLRPLVVTNIYNGPVETRLNPIKVGVWITASRRRVIAFIVKIKEPVINDVTYYPFIKLLRCQCQNFEFSLECTMAAKKFWPSLS